MVEWSAAFATIEHGVHKSDFDDSELLNFANPVLYITGIKFYSGDWYKQKVIFGMEVTYNNGKTILHGGKDHKLCQVQECKLDKDERIIEVSLRAGHMIDGMSFKTNKRTLGPYGGGGGGKNVLRGSQLSYLAALKGQVYFDDGGLAVKHLQFGWATRMCDKCPCCD